MGVQSQYTVIVAMHAVRNDEASCLVNFGFFVFEQERLRVQTNCTATKQLQKKHIFHSLQSFCIHCFFDLMTNPPLSPY